MFVTYYGISPSFITTTTTIQDTAYMLALPLRNTATLGSSDENNDAREHSNIYNNNDTLFLPMFLKHLCFVSESHTHILVLHPSGIWKMNSASTLKYTENRAKTQDQLQNVHQFDRSPAVQLTKQKFVVTHSTLDTHFYTTQLD